MENHKIVAEIAAAPPGPSSAEVSPAPTPTRSQPALPPSPAVYSYVQSKQLPVAAVPSHETPDGRDAAVAAVLATLWPREAQAVYRASTVAFVTRVVRRALNAKTFEIGFHAVSCFLPDDPVRLTVLLWRGNSANWLNMLHERLIHAGSGGFGGGYDDGHGEPVGGAYGGGEGGDLAMAMASLPPSGSHTVSHVTPSAVAGNNRMMCSVDALAVEIVPNGRADICFLAFLEDFAKLVGKVRFHNQRRIQVHHFSSRLSPFLPLSCIPLPTEGPLVQALAAAGAGVVGV